VYLNVKGRDRQGCISPGDFEKVRDDLKARLEAAVDHGGGSLRASVFRPEEIYGKVRGVAPDLIVHFGRSPWQSLAAVGYSDVCLQDSGTLLDDCSPAQFGTFILASPHSPLYGELHGVHLLDIAPTLLDLGGYDRPESMQGTSLVERLSAASPVNLLRDDEEALVRQQLSGLGYI
jgi:predicted AlkP superfamily phosphohydrolase/phosphomutase